MELATKAAGFSAERLERITDHLKRNYIGPGKIAGCQVAVARHGHIAYFKSFGLMDLERGKPIARRHHLPHLFDDQADHLGRADDRCTSRATSSSTTRSAASSPRGRTTASGSPARATRWRPRRPTGPITFRDVLSHTGGLTYGGGLPGIGDQHPVDKVYRS